MALDLYMVGLVPRDMERSLEFYQRLGVAFPDGDADRPHVQVKMGGGIHFFLNTRTPIEGTDSRTILEFFLPGRAEVDAKHAAMTGYGYRSHADPFETSFGMYFAMINDPDGTIVLLSAE